MMRQLKEADLKAIGGISSDDRMLRGLGEIVDVGVNAIPDFGRIVREGGSIKQWWAAVREACHGLREANAETALGFLLRKGVSTAVNDFYHSQPTQYDQYCLTTGSTTVAEWYAPLYNSTIAGPIANGAEFPESAIIGENSNIVNVVFGKREAVERTLFDDDQTGQIAQRARLLAESMATLKEIWTSFRYLGTARTYANVTVPASGYSTTDINGTAITTPFSTSIYGTYGNRPSSFGILNVGHMKVALTTLLKAVDPLQNRIIVKADCLLHSNDDALNADMLLFPGPYPATPGQSDTTLANNPVLGGTSATAGTSQGAYAGFAGGAFASNPFGRMGIKGVRLPYWPSWAWAIMEAKKGFVLQERDPVEVIQEAPNSGSYFNFDTIQWRSRWRGNADWVGGGSRFAYLGNDGTVTGTN